MKQNTRRSSFHAIKTSSSKKDSRFPFFDMGSSQRPKVKFHSAWNNVGKRDCTGIKPKKLMFEGFDQPIKPLNSKMFKELLKEDVGALLFSSKKSKIGAKKRNSQKEGNNFTPVKLQFDTDNGDNNVDGGMAIESERVNHGTAKKRQNTKIELLEGGKTKSGKKHRKKSGNLLDKRSNSFSSSIAAPLLSNNKAIDSNRKQKKRDNLVIHRWRNGDKIFNGKFSHRPKQSYYGSSLNLMRSNSDVTLVYESDRSFNKKVENGYQGINKYLNAGGIKFKAPETRNGKNKLKHKNIVDQMNHDEMVFNLPKIQENDEFSGNSPFSLRKRQSGNAENPVSYDLFGKRRRNNGGMAQEMGQGRQDRGNDDDFDMNNMDIELENFTFQRHESKNNQFDSPGNSSMVEETPLKPGKMKHRNLINLLNGANNAFNPVQEPSVSPFNPGDNSLDLKGDYINPLARPSDSFKELNPIIKHSDSFKEMTISPCYQFPHINGSFNESTMKEENSISRFDNDFEVIDNLGSGNFGRVYKCKNKLDGLMYAVKITSKSLQKSNLKFAVNEALALASLNAAYENPNIVRFYNAWYEDERLHLVMECCQGSLADFMKKDRVKFTESMIRRILRDMCCCLKFLHQHNIVHLDIKPENILYSYTKKYKLADLGLSRLSYRAKGEDIIEGDSRYMAPELLQEVDEFGGIPDLRKADIFSLGATMYELMIGHALPKNGHEWHVLRSGQDLTKFKSCNFSNSLKTLVINMMKPKADDRPDVFQILQKYLLSDTELELRWVKKNINSLQAKIGEYENKLKIRRKNSY